MSQTSVSPERKPDWRFLIYPFIIAISLYLLGAWVQYQIDKRTYDQQMADSEKRSAERNETLAKELNTYSTPIIQAIYQYNNEHSEYPKDLSILIPQYLQKEPYAAFGEKLLYSPQDYYGAPFYFGFRGNYPGLAFMHGWAYIYCPSSSCDVIGVGVNRFDDNWIYIHSSWN
jgi:hypothetical protein